jgi:hypothetical protein
MRGFINITYDCEDKSTKEDKDAKITIENEILCRWKKHEQGSKCSCEKKLNCNNDVNLAYETPPELG